LAVLSVRQALAAVAELQEASLQLVCWQLSVREHAPGVERTIADDLLARRGVDALHGEVNARTHAAGRPRPDRVIRKSRGLGPCSPQVRERRRERRDAYAATGAARGCRARAHDSVEARDRGRYGTPVLSRASGRPPALLSGSRRGRNPESLGRIPRPHRCLVLQSAVAGAYCGRPAGRYTGASLLAGAWLS
jgi:hypothetical protein